MRLTFLGTRGNIRIASARHRRHSALLVEVGTTRVLVDAGTDWLEEVAALRPDAVLVTHAHPDHAGGLKRGAPCPIFATEETLDALARYPIEGRAVTPGASAHVGPLAFTAYPVEHSLLAPAVGYRLAHRRARVFYVPDVLGIPDARGALAGVTLYAGDGATYGRAIVRRRDGRAFGHATIETQLDWCAENAVRRAVFTHCGSRVVRVEPREAAERIAALGEARGVEASIAEDGQVLELPEE